MLTAASSGTAVQSVDSVEWLLPHTTSCEHTGGAMLFGVQEAVQQHTHVVIVPGSGQLAPSEEDSVHDALAQRMGVLHYRQFGRGTRYIGGFLRVAHVPPRRDGTPGAAARPDARNEENQRTKIEVRRTEALSDLQYGLSAYRD